MEMTEGSKEADCLAIARVRHQQAWPVEVYLREGINDKRLDRAVGRWH